MCRRIFNQMGGFPIDIIGNYGMQYAEYNSDTQNIETIFDKHRPVDKESVEKRVTMLREKYGFTEFRGDNVEHHSSGCLTFPILGTKALIEDKLSFDPDRTKRRKILADVKNTFSDYTVFVGGSSSFDLAPFPFDKVTALHKYCEQHGLNPDEVVYIGDDYGEGGNDESVYLSDFNYLKNRRLPLLPQSYKGFTITNLKGSLYDEGAIFCLLSAALRAAYLLPNPFYLKKPPLGGFFLLFNLRIHTAKYASANTMTIILLIELPIKNI